jgi:hypothetical protein
VHPLFPLLDALCDGSLTADQHAQLEKLVQEDSEARKLYVDYMHLHGTLAWDASLTDPASLVAIAERAGEEPVAAPRRQWSRIGWVGGIVSAALALLLFMTRETSAPLQQEIAAVAETPGSVSETPTTVQSPLVVEEGLPLPTFKLDRPTESPSPAPSMAVVPVEPKPLAPSAINDADVVRRVDALMERVWADAGVQPSAVAEDSEWLRRIYLDMAGHIPDSTTVDQFLSDTRPDKRKRLVDELIALPDYTRNMATIWSNLLVGRTSDRPINRDLLAKFLREQFRRNRPWTETVERLVSAEGDGDKVGEANFLLAHLNNEAVPATAVTARIFLCQQVQCTQCHKHPDPQHGGSMAEFWELNSFFQQAQVVENRKYNPTTGHQEVVSRSLVDRDVGGPTFYEDLKGVMRVAYPRFAGQEVSPDGTTRRRHELARLMTTQGQHEVAAALVNRTWAYFFGQGLVNPIDDMGPHSPCANPELLEALTQYVIATNFDVERLNRWIVSSRAYHLSSTQTAGNEADQPVDGELPLFSRMYIKPLSAEQLFDSLLVATAADRAGASYWEQADSQRRQWLGQFYQIIENEENSDASTFGGTFSQTLMMMNGDLVRSAISNAPGTVLHEILHMGGDDQDRIRHLCRAALGRDPKPKELAAFQPALRRANSPADPYGDIFWAYLNSSEFAVNH